MEVQINLLAVVLASVVAMAFSAVWYSQRLFGGVWCRLAKLKGVGLKIESTRGALLVLVASLLTAYVLAHIIYLAHAFFGNSYIKDALVTAFWMWFGIVAVRIIAQDTFERRPLQLTVINISHELITLLLMASVIGLVKI